jgi:hypothetical protein
MAIGDGVGDAMGDGLHGDFRKAMRTLASAVSIISTAIEARRFGMTATAVCSLSMEPPALLLCINQSPSLHQPLLDARRFCVNILHADQDELARTFSRQQIEDRFARGGWQADDAGVPFLVDAQACSRANLSPPYAVDRHRRSLSRRGARPRASAPVPGRTLYRRSRRGRRLGHSNRELIDLRIWPPRLARGGRMIAARPMMGHV